MLLFNIRSNYFKYILPTLSRVNPDKMTIFFLLPSLRSIHTFNLDGERFVDFKVVLVFLVCFSHVLKGSKPKRKLPAEDKSSDGEQTEKNEMLDDCWRIKMRSFFSQLTSIRAF